MVRKKVEDDKPRAVADAFELSPTGKFAIMHSYVGMQEWHETGNFRLLCDTFKFAYDYCIPILINDWNMPDGAKDANAALIFCNNMGFETIPLVTGSKIFWPWIGNPLYFLRSWTPGLNVNPYGLWSSICDNSKCEQYLPHVDVYWDRYDKYDSKKFIKEVPEWDGIDTSIIPLTKDGQEYDGLHLDGRTYEYSEKAGFLYDDKLISPYPIRIEKAELPLEGQQQEEPKRRRRRRK